jgi:twinkle protein
MDLATWAASRGISTQVLDKCGVKQHSVGFPEGVKDSVIFHYYRDRKSVNWKARAFDEKLFKQQTGGEQRFYNMDTFPTDVLYVTEGEIDCLSLIEAGLPGDQCVSVPIGAPASTSDAPWDAQRYSFILKAMKDGLAPKKYVLVMDGDEPGQHLMHDLAKLFGPGKCYYIKWPDGLKDANDYLMESGPAALHSLVTEFQVPYPLEGVYSLNDLGEPEPMIVWNPGFPEWEQKILLSPGMLSCATGFPGHGKTHFWQQVWFQIAKQYGFPIAIMSAETRPKPHVRRYMRQFYWAKREFDQTDHEKQEADDWTHENVKFIIHPNTRPTFRFFMDSVESAWARYGIRAVQMDPWNKLESDRGSQRETEWIGDCLDQVLDAARGMNVHFQIICHPAKPESQDRSKFPDLYSISGSAHWANRVDQGFSIHRPQIVDESGTRQTKAVLYHLKARFDELGYPCKVNLDFDPSTGRFFSIDYDAIMD